jgi:NAD(P)-dependent dehydrogenase (short-subunit alcohol dehydrogenase family)
MTSQRSLVVLITGASSGFGLSAAIYLKNRGYRVFGGARRFPDPTQPFETLGLDVTDQRSVDRAIGQILEQAGRIDALANNAGVARVGAVEHHSPEDVQLILETNTVATYRMCRAVLPHFRERCTGRIVNVTSLAGRVALPFAGLYCASKFAVEGLSESLRLEVSPFGVRVSVLEPGYFLTAMTAKYELTEATQGDSAYRDRLVRAVATMERDCTRSANLLPVARKLEAILSARRPRFRYTVGLPSQRLGALVLSCAPGWLSERLIRWVYQV